MTFEYATIIGESRGEAKKQVVLRMIREPMLGNLLSFVIGLKASVAGITIIALGTSLPDTFTSRTAALHDEYADTAMSLCQHVACIKDSHPSMHQEFVVGELGGKNNTVKALSTTFMVFLWVIYIALSSIKAGIVRLSTMTAYQLSP
ncbi:hypothetical protein NP493_719g00001 [Ridgeia piscesae]|uniref:Sodium/calcium exchanger membrane region domain-containing protein n=1 Tax=Ridgeia piscesae TaxID=27915 RepID=A0AAD9KQE9_RIDPI|nr:hypothetical protein NP493_719g00001 [Ridgeia piscesae]